MSLVNDALKRATEAHKNSAPEPRHYLPLRPAEPAGQRRAHLVLPATLATILVAALIALWLARRGDRPQSNPSSKESFGPTVITALARETPAIITPVMAAATVQTESLPTSAPEIAAPQLAPLKLQAVFYNPARPSAIISGKTVFVGDKVRELQVVAIGSASAMLVSATQTNVLTME